MNTKIKSLLVILSLSLSSQLNAQDVYTGYRISIRDNSSETVYNRASTRTRYNIYSTRFSTFLKNIENTADTLYTVQIDFDTEDKTIEIRLQDEVSKKYDIRRFKFQVVPASYSALSSKAFYTVKDYKLNDTTLTSIGDNKAMILFTIADTVKPVIYLHQFISLDSTYRYELDRVRETYLTNHLINAKSYWKYQNEVARKKYNDSLMVARNNETLLRLRQMIEAEKIKMMDEKDSIFLILEHKQQNYLSSNIEASPEAQRYFQERMDKILYDQYKTDLINKRIQSKYEVLALTNNRNVIITKPLSGNQYGNDKHFRDEYLAEVDSSILRLDLKNELIILVADDPLSVILSNHDLRFSSIKNEMILNRMDYDKEFKPLFEEIQKEANKRFGKRSIEVPTRYQCQFNYATNTDWQKWRLKHKKLTDSYGFPVNPTSSNYIFLYNKYPRAKNGKYAVKVNTATINNKVIDPTALDIKRKYKFVTRFGVSGGLIDPLTDFDVKLIPERLYYNAFFVYHHFGVFGGLGSFTLEATEESSTYKQQYYEGGFYLAPGNVLYFKLGAAVSKDPDLVSIQPLGGISLIFGGIQLEGGYNLLFKKPYVMAGMNIPLNL